MTKKKSSKQLARERRAAKEAAAQNRNKILFGLIGLLALFAIIFVAFRSFGGGGDTSGELAAGAMETDRPLAALSPAERDNYYDAPPEMVIDTSKTYQAIFKTSKGDITIDLYDDEAPITVNNLVFLANEGFYDGLLFHRVIEDFMAQGGDPTGTGSSGPGYRFEDEIVPSLVFDKRGILAMANSGPATNGSQFFITFEPTPWLDGNHTIYGQLSDGEDALMSITQGDVIESVVIIES